MSYALMKLYKHGALYVASTSDVFRKPEVHNSSHYLDIQSFRSSHCRAKQYLDKLSIADKNSIYLHIRAVERDKRLKFNSFIGDVKSKRQVYDYNDTSSESIRKARRRITDICFCNDFNYFCTLTFDPSLVNSTDPVSVISYLNKFCKNYFRRNKGYYIFVPEKHKSGAIHFHGLIFTNNFDSHIVRAFSPDTGEPLVYKGRDVYNLASWSGHSILYPLDSRNILNSVKYIIKYITKDNRCLPRFYYSGGQLVRKPALVYVDADSNEFDRLLDSGAFELTNLPDSCPVKMCALWLDDAYNNLDEF